MIDEFIVNVGRQLNLSQSDMRTVESEMQSNLGKFLADADDKAKTEATNKAVKRIIYALLVFLIPTIISFIFKTIENYSSKDSNISTTPTSWVSCWNYFYNK